ncbi:hypothetical protein VTG60DRAFT_3999 [Thermothelomyces hinnuleus]
MQFQPSLTSNPGRPYPIDSSLFFAQLIVSGQHPRTLSTLPQQHLPVSQARTHGLSPWLARSSHKHPSTFKHTHTHTHTDTHHRPFKSLVHTKSASHPANYLSI